MTGVRVQKILSQCGISSRREAEKLISQGLVTINGRTAKLGDRAALGKDAIKVHGKLLREKAPQLYIAFHKPKGVIAMITTDLHNRPTLSHYLTKLKHRVFPVGRMDFNTEGLLLLTNNGEFAQELRMNSNLSRTYIVKVSGHPTPDALTRLEKVFRSKHSKLQLESIRVCQRLTKKVKIEVCLIGQGKAEMKALFEKAGFLVERVIRTAIGPLKLKDLQPGEYRFLKKNQVDVLK